MLLCDYVKIFSPFLCFVSIHLKAKRGLNMLLDNIGHWTHTDYFVDHDLCILSPGQTLGYRHLICTIDTLESNERI